MIELTGLKAIRERIEELKVEQRVDTESGYDNSAAFDKQRMLDVEFAEEQEKSDLRAIEAELYELKRAWDSGKVNSAFIGRILALISAIDSALGETKE